MRFSYHSRYSLELYNLDETQADISLEIRNVLPAKNFESPNLNFYLGIYQQVKLYNNYINFYYD